MDRKKINELIENRNQSIKPLANIVRDDSVSLFINGHKYDLIVDEGNAFDLESFSKTYVPPLSHYDFIFGDIGYGKLRLKGFFSNNRNVNPLNKIASVDSYLSEFCNFGSPYFILHNLEAKTASKTSFKFHKKRSIHSDFNRHHGRKEGKTHFKGHKNFKIIVKKH